MALVIVFAILMYVVALVCVPVARIFPGLRDVFFCGAISGAARPLVSATA